MNSPVPKTERHISEECGVFGIYSPKYRDLASLVYYGLYALQHRGQESAGIVVNLDGVFRAHRDAGLVNDVFSRAELDSLGPGNIAVGHVRYATTGSDVRSNAQPLLINHYQGRLALAHNGNLTNSAALRNALEEKGSLFQHLPELIIRMEFLNAFLIRIEHATTSIKMKSVIIVILRIIYKIILKT